MSSTSPRTRRPQAGMTVLEIMIVLAIMAGAFYIVRSGFRLVSKADLVEDSTELTAVVRRTSQLAVEHGELHRILFDMETGAYVVELCKGSGAIQRNEQLQTDPEQTKRALEQGKQRLDTLSTQGLVSDSIDEDDPMHRAAAIAGHHIADRMCKPATDTVTGDAAGKAWLRKLKKDKGIKFKNIYVQHRDDAVTKGQVAIYFFPLGSSEKSVIELTDGSEVFSVLIWGLTGRVELHDGAIKDIESHMLKNVMGDKDAKREDSK
ncbi:MAG TPA: prepilin-type N-terminal cleavage/methylation domain-containing protein [Kofleriaceae bacterium]|nr:prepilin-type N-terminal cleavage/methylation domain-containing protein [Kofleriaceae bacterium]